MIKIKNPNRIKRTLEIGEITCRDTESGYKYSLWAFCPNDHYECSVASFERATAEESKIKRVTFYCPICSSRFDA
jgi:hypothetical protein